jgi:hypothetical protein
MITLNGKIHRQFYFPADPYTSLIYFSELSRVTPLLPHITVIENYTSEKVRIRYQTVELGAYTINIICDLVSTVDVEKMEISIGPLSGCQEVKSESTLNATTGYGYYASHAKLYEEEDGTGIDYDFQFKAELQRPRGLRMVPKRVVDRIAQGISSERVEEIVEGFVENAYDAFPDWHAQQPRDLVKKWLANRQQVERETNTASR